MRPILILFGFDEFAAENCLKLHACGDPVQVYRAMESLTGQGGDAARVYVLADAANAGAAWTFAAEYPDRVAAMAVLGGSADPELVQNLKYVPVLLGADDTAYAGTISANDAYRLLRAEGNTDAQSTACLTVERALEWARAYDISDRQEINWIRPGLWNINTGLIDSLYLAEGSDRSVVIDTGMGRKDITPLLRTLTDKPLLLLATHVHGDHILHADEFDTVYMSEREFPLLPLFADKMMPEKGYTAERFTPIAEGDRIVLGNGESIDVIELPGHTPGSLVFIDHKHKAVFTGDAIGSGFGVLMAIPGALPTEEYLANLLTFRDKIEPYRDYSFYGGHRIQEKGADRTSHAYNPLCVELIDDMITLCRKLLRGETVEIEEQRNAFSDKVLYASYRRANMWGDADALEHSRAIRHF